MSPKFKHISRLFYAYNLTNYWERSFKIKFDIGKEKKGQQPDFEDQEKAFLAMKEWTELLNTFIMILGLEAKRNLI